MILLSTSQLAEKTSLSRVTLWRFRRRFPDFPKPVRLGSNLRWVESEIDDWFLRHRLVQED